MAASLTSTDLTLDNTSGASIPGTPSAGQTVLYPKDDKLLYYKDDAGVERRVDAGLGYIHVRDEKANGSSGGSSTGSAWTARVLNTVVSNTISGASLASNQITLPTGTYLVVATAPLYLGSANYIRNRFRNTTDSTTTALSASLITGNDVSLSPDIIGTRFTIAAAKVYELQYWTASARGTNGLGAPTTTGELEVFGEVIITKEA